VAWLVISAFSGTGGKCPEENIQIKSELASKLTMHPGRTDGTAMATPQQVAIVYRYWGFH